MKCHYEVLDVPRDADDSEIKSAYRKLALRWHPDKNLDNAELAKEQFQIVQQAYEVLSDRQERAWYDNHREQILRGSSSEFQDESLDVFQYFTTTCFKGYGDDEHGFYSVYCSVFQKISEEDMEFVEEKEEFCNIPSFGNSETSYENVSEFYNYWLNYSTKKSYVWLDPHDIRDIKQRRYVKLVEKENKKVRLQAKKERNEEVRNLVAFVRKRDRRVLAQKKLQEQKLQEDKKKRELLIKQKKLERQQELNESGTQPEWAKFDNFKSELEQIEQNLAEQFGEDNSDSDYDEDEYLSNLYCVACNKIFKTPKAFENHEISKKHRENMELLKEIMLKEDLYRQSNISDNFEDYNDLTVNPDDLYEIIEQDIHEDDSLTDTDSIEGTVKNKRKKKKIRNVISTDLFDLPGLSSDLKPTVQNQESDKEFESNSDKKKKKKSKRNPTKVNEPKLENSEKVGEIASETIIKVVPSKKPKKEKRIRKEVIPADLQDIDTDHSCVMCKSDFSSKNKLFDHLKKTGHGVYIPPNVKNKSKKKNIKEI